MKIVNLDDIRHSVRVANLSLDMARLLYFNKPDIDNLYLACIFHDIGKAHVDQVVLNKTDVLTSDERFHIQEHSYFSSQEMKNLGYSKDITDIILYHHENYDGSGYPKGLIGDSIPIGARILKITDVFDALTMDRPYRKRLSIQETLKIMENEKHLYDPELYSLFIGYLSFKEMGLNKKTGGNKKFSKADIYNIIKTIHLNGNSLNRDDITKIRSIALGDPSHNDLIRLNRKCSNHR